MNQNFVCCTDQKKVLSIDVIGVGGKGEDMCQDDSKTFDTGRSLDSDKQKLRQGRKKRYSGKCLFQNTSRK